MPDQAGTMRTRLDSVARKGLRANHLDESGQSCLVRFWSYYYYIFKLGKGDAAMKPRKIVAGPIKICIEFGLENCAVTAFNVAPKHAQEPRCGIGGGLGLGGQAAPGSIVRVELAGK